MQEHGRYGAPGSPRLADGWTLERLTPPSRLYGANGMRIGPDGRIYVAQVSGSSISAIDAATGAVEIISPMGSDIVAPDDLVFDDAGNLYATEITEGRVSMLAPNGRTRVVCGDMPGANPITFHRGRLFAGECRPGARILELDRNGGAPRVLAADIAMANAMEVGPDGKLYYPVMGLNEIWRVGLDGGAPEKVAGDLGVPDSVKFDSKGFIVSTQVASGEVLRIDPQTGAKTVLAQLSDGLDNVVFLGERIFVSNISGYVKEILPSGETRDLVPDGFNWPLGLAWDNGELIIADGPFSYALKPGGERRRIGFLFTPGCPGYMRGVASSGPGEYVIATANGHVARWRPAEQKNTILAEALDRPYGVALTSAGGVMVAEAGGGRVVEVADGKVETLASGLKEPMGVALAADGVAYVSEAHGGRVVKLAGGRAETVLDGLSEPQGLAISGGKLYIVDAGAKTLIEFDPTTKRRRAVAEGLAVGPPTGVKPKFLKAIPPLSGPMGPFAGVAAGPDGALYVSADAEGSVLRLWPA